MRTVGFRKIAVRKLFIDKNEETNNILSSSYIRKRFLYLALQKYGLKLANLKSKNIITKTK